MSPSVDRLFAALEATWPPASSQRLGPFRLRDGAGGGKRVSAAVQDGEFDAALLDQAEAAMGARPLFQVRDGQAALDQALAARGYTVIDPTILYAAPIDQIAEAPRPVSLLEAWEPLAIQRQIWADGGVGPDRVAVMLRACDPKTSFAARFRNRAAGAGFVAVHDGIAMMHALQIEPEFRRAGVARYSVRGMAHWARNHGATTLALAVTQRNNAARGLYEGLGMEQAGAYHYRGKSA
tara:strand:+ start:10413 stop:11123 length:711 start_codon:yes stop_codon:yes gene_type:complete